MAAVRGIVVQCALSLSTACSVQDGSYGFSKSVVVQYMYLITDLNAHSPVQDGLYGCSKRVYDASLANQVCLAKRGVMFVAVVRGFMGHGQ